MREVFKGWKRKVGCATLGLACAFMAWWVRSYDGSPLWIPLDSWSSLVPLNGNIRLWTGELETVDFGNAMPRMTIVRSKEIWSFSFGWIVIPLTLLSAFLLLSKPPPAKPISTKLPESA